MLYSNGLLFIKSQLKTSFIVTVMAAWYDLRVIAVVNKISVKIATIYNNVCDQSTVAIIYSKMASQNYRTFERSIICYSENVYGAHG